MSRRTDRISNARGSVFFYILLGVALFAALAFTVSRGMKGQRTENLSKQEIKLAVSEILDHAQDLAKGVDRLRRKNISESDLCFSHSQNSATTNAAYANISTCGDDTYTLYHKNGGNVSYQSIPDSWQDAQYASDLGYGEWLFTNKTAVIGAGTGALNVKESLELVAHINYLKEAVCVAINEKLGITGIPDNGTSFELDEPVTSGFTTASSQINQAALDGHYSGCFLHSDVTDPNYIFYTILIQR